MGFRARRSSSNITPPIPIETCRRSSLVRSVLACFKLGILLEGTFARACAGQADMRLGERFPCGAYLRAVRARIAVLVSSRH